MGLFSKYYYIRIRKSNGKPYLYGPLRNRDKNGNLGKGSLCKDENEARRVAEETLNGKWYELFPSKYSTIERATKEDKGDAFTRTGDLDMSTKRVSHKHIPENKEEENEIINDIESI